MNTYFAGLDWGSTEHALCVVDGQGQIRCRAQVRHDAQGVHRLLEQLARIAPPAQVPIAIERPSGLLVDTLLQAGHPVVPIHPNAVKACRVRYRAAAGKHDAGDAYLLADVLRTDGHRFGPLTAPSDELKALRAQVRARDDLLAQRIGLANQLRALLESFWPGACAVFADIDSPIALAFLQRYPTPDSAARLGQKRLASFLAGQHYRGRRTPAELLGRLRAAPPGQAGHAEQQAKGALVCTLVRVLRVLVKELSALTTRIEYDLTRHPDGPLLMSLPRIGCLNAAQILAELGDVRERFAGAEQLAGESGVVPVTHQSGKTRVVGFRWACNHRLRRAITLWADNSRHAAPWAAHVYAQARARGCRHAHAVRILARAWTRVLWRIWTSRTPYDPHRHTAAAPFLEAA